jgi:predicted thioredoxin/glutaredoxin
MKIHSQIEKQSKTPAILVQLWWLEKNKRVENKIFQQFFLSWIILKQLIGKIHIQMSPVMNFVYMNDKVLTVMACLMAGHLSPSITQLSSTVTIMTLYI